MYDAVLVDLAAVVTVVVVVIAKADCALVFNDDGGINMLRRCNADDDVDLVVDVVVVVVA